MQYRLFDPGPAMDRFILNAMANGQSCRQALYEFRAYGGHVGEMPWRQRWHKLEGEQQCK